MKTTEKTISSTTVYSGKIITVKRDEVMLSDGNVSFREEVLHSGGACVLAVYNGKVALVEQFRYAYKKDVLEIPAGKLEAGENPYDCAKRELVEEVGLRANSLTKIAEVYPSPGYTNEVIHIFYTDDVEKTSQKLDEGEFLNVKFFTLSELDELVSSGQLCDAKTLIAYYHLKLLTK